MRAKWVTYFTRRARQRNLKHQIRKRLATEDYTCRLPKIKPRVRYKLRWAIVHEDGKQSQMVWR